jgi:hypothetical protein
MLASRPTRPVIARPRGRASSDGAQTLAAALMDCDASERWGPLRDLILAGLEAGGLRHAPDSAALRTASGELAAVALDARRRVGGKTAATPDRHFDAS